MISPASKGLFHRAFIQSPMSFSYYPTKEDANATATSLSAIFQCGTTPFRKCIQNLDAPNIVGKTKYYATTCAAAQVPKYGYNIDKAYWYCGIAPEVGNDVLPGQMMNSVQSTTGVNAVPIMIGTVWNEGLSDSGATYNPLRQSASTLYATQQINLTQLVYQQFLNQIVDLKSYENDNQSYNKLYSKRARDIYDMYPYSSNNSGFGDIYPLGYNGFDISTPFDANYAYNALYHDKWYLCASMYAMSLVQNKNMPVYMYRFKQRTVLNYYLYFTMYGGSPSTAIENDFYSKNLYPSHGDDIPFFHFSINNLYTDDEKKLGFRMFSALVDFISTGNPNDGPLKSFIGDYQWESYNHSKRNMMYLSEPNDADPRTQKVREAQCKFWENLNFEFSTSDSFDLFSSLKALSITSVFSVFLIWLTY